MNDGTMIVLIFAAIVVIPTTIVFLVLGLVRHARKKKLRTCTGVTQGRLVKIKHKGADHPFVLYVTYEVDGAEYQVKETAKLKSHAIKLGPVPVGTRKTFVLGDVHEGDLLEVRYDVARPEKALIYGNEGLMNT